MVGRFQAFTKARAELLTLLWEKMRTGHFLQLFSVLDDLAY